MNTSDPAELRSPASAPRAFRPGQCKDHWITKEVATATNEAWIYGRLATCYTFGPEKLRNPQRALEHAETAIQKRDANASFHTLHGVCLYRIGRHRDAIDVLERTYEVTVKTKEGPTAMNRFFAAMSYQCLGNPVKAKECYALALKLPQPTGHPGLIPNWVELMRAEADAVLKIPAKK